jgi:predicted transcriptional regulator
MSFANYAAGAIIMPYGKFLRAAEEHRYAIDRLCAQFASNVEQVAHRLTTLSRVGARGLPFFMIRIDRAGQVSKRYAGASGAALVEAPGRCPLWRLHHAFDRPGSLVVDLVELEDDSRCLTMARTVVPQGRRYGGVEAMFAVGLGIEAALAAPLAAARGIDLAGEATPIGLGCRACTRSDCPQRSAAPAARALAIDDRERGVSAFTFVAD